MNNEQKQLSEQERQAIEDFAMASTKIEHAILSNRLNESVQAYNDGKYIGIKLGVKFALSELRKPSEPIYCPTCGYRVRLKGDGTMEQLCNCAEWSEWSEPSEELVEKIEKTMKMFAPLEKIDIDNFYNVATEIAKLLPSSRNYENDEKPVPDPIFRVGCIVPYLNSRSKISFTKIEKFQIEVNGSENTDVWFHGIDVKTGAKTWYPLHKSIKLAYGSQEKDAFLTESELKDLKRVRNYFGEHDVTPIEHFAYSFLDGLLDKLKANRENDWISPKTMPELGERVIVKFKHTEGGCDNYEIDVVLKNPKGQKYFSMTEYEDIIVIGWKYVETNISKLLPPRSRENDVNVELLEALKKIRFETSNQYIWTISNDAISNYEKQMKR